MLNRIILIGRLTRDVELRYTQEGKAVANFTLAVDRPFKNQQGEKEADFIRIATWGKLAENCANHIGKGRLVAVDGRLQIRSYDGNDGQRKYITEVVADEVKFLDWPKDDNYPVFEFDGSDCESMEGDPF
ncbi:Single-stranded DNA-binding protein [Tepidanaerobacter acetatoxydans Re1]|uniref:Single-stranded DNA-binding protein n=1 Tax=Tepidanaerobacter acetatoxydans (strain DSM 21804 / JCM 16047 / Re1) TaxID=1209989 RepID=F4LSB8_TEPAE|nr:single-stranded DNA-binding protein [Tepidanaerobacter acetatoxydans]AEE91184.1 single-strand binding protein [Tepidanaerobacter acetatoxydans Re1]CCP25854.1 Single-stranded DNA-binding protein [Tepidanaerobacter acetatoxydans Re1]